jgi:PAT family beta-lactamase induction signal transducer AmpG
MLRVVTAAAPAPSSGWDSFWATVLRVFTSRRLASVALLSFASGLPLGLVWIAIPAWMARVGVDIKVVGLFTLAQAPWSFKFLWSPLMDRYAPPFLGRKRGWMLLGQVGLLLLGLWLAGVSDHPEAVWVIGSLALAIGLLAATHDIAYDAYSVEVLEPEEQGLAVGARTALYRIAMFVSGGLSITLASSFDVPLPGGGAYSWHGSWALVNLVLALCYLPFLVVTWLAPDPSAPPAPPQSLKEALWGPFIGLLGQHRALDILAFVVLFKLSDNLTQSLLRPFFVQVGFNDTDVGVATMTIGTLGIMGGTILGGLLTNFVGLGRALWITGVLQMGSNLGYAVVAQVGPHRPTMYAAQAFEYVTSGLGTGAFGVLLLRLTEKRFSATQYALLSSLFSLPRVLAGPPTGLLVDAIGWRDFFVLTVAAGLPGLVMLHRFVPWREREPRFHVEALQRGAPLTRGGLIWRCGMVGLGALVASAATVAALEGARAVRAGRAFALGERLLALLQPAGLGDVLTLIGIVVVAASVVLGTAAALVARRGLAVAPASGQE